MGFEKEVGPPPGGETLRGWPATDAFLTTSRSIMGPKVLKRKEEPQHGKRKNGMTGVVRGREGSLIERRFGTGGSRGKGRRMFSKAAES